MSDFTHREGKSPTQQEKSTHIYRKADGMMIGEVFKYDSGFMGKSHRCTPRVFLSREQAIAWVHGLEMKREEEDGD